MSARAMLARVRRLERGDTSPLLKIIGSVEAFEHGITVEVKAGRMCSLDGPVIAMCVRRWVTGTFHHRDGNVMASHSHDRR